MINIIEQRFIGNDITRRIIARCTTGTRYMSFVLYEHNAFVCTDPLYIFGELVKWERANS